jgi:hypothetical protein
MVTDEEKMPEVITNPDIHALNHENTVDELDAMWKAIMALEHQVDSVYEITLKLVAAINTLMPVPIELEEQ